MTTPSKRGKVVVIAGLIASGKSTLAAELAEAIKDALFLAEPDERDNANPYLGLFYGDKLRWPFTMQVHLLALRFRQHQQAQWHAMNTGGVAVLDSSYFQDTCFARMLVKAGDMSPDEFTTYRTLYQAMTASVLLPNVCIRVLVDPVAAQQRLATRLEQRTGRAPEKVIDLGYLQALDHEIGHMVGTLRGLGVTTIDLPWDTERESPAQRAQTVRALAQRILALEPVDLFLDLHRRTP